jgi:hypothetical protein
MDIPKVKGFETPVCWNCAKAEKLILVSKSYGKDDEQIPLYYPCEAYQFGDEYECEYVSITEARKIPETAIPMDEITGGKESLEKMLVDLLADEQKVSRINSRNHTIPIKCPYLGVECREQFKADIDVSARFCPDCPIDWEKVR